MEFPCRYSIVFFLAFGFTLSSGSSSDRHLFDDLTEDELNEVMEYLYRQPDLGLSKTVEPGLKTSYLRLVEAVNPDKDDALKHLDQNGPKPVRKAIAILYRGDLVKPKVLEVIVSPIPNPTTHIEYRNSKIKNPIPYTARTPLNPIELNLVSEKLSRVLPMIEPIIKEATNGYTFTNCTRYCLDWCPGGPPQINKGGHKMLGYLVRKVEGKYLHPIGLQWVLNMEALDIEQWTITYVSWQGQEFNNFEAMKRAHDQGQLKTKKLNIPKNLNTKDMSSSLNFRGTPRPAKSQRGAKCNLPDGQRFKEENRHVEWLGWEFDFGVRTSTGIQVFDIKFLKERIVYELSLQELVVQYSGGDAQSRHTLFYDSDAMLGYSGTELFPGIDCPDDGKLLDAVHFHEGEALTYKNSICIFEWDKTIPIRRHYASNNKGGYKHYQGMPDNVLILRTIPTIDNYDYIMDIVFHQDGKIEVKTSLTGYLVTTFYQGDNVDKYGYVVDENAIANIHIHLVNFKVDLDIAGERQNRMTTIDLKLENIHDRVNQGQNIRNHFVERNVKKSEKEAAYKSNFDKPKYIIFETTKKKNRFGSNRAYRLHISDMGKYLLPIDYRGARALAWAQYQVAVTKYNKEETRSSSPYNFMEPFEPMFSFQDFIDNDENIVDKDLVAWVTMAAHHIPHTEDVPIVTTTGVQLTFYLLPYNYFDEDPSLASRDNMRVTPGEKDGHHIFHYSGVPGGRHCDKPNIECRGTTVSHSSDAVSHSSHIDMENGNEVDASEESGENIDSHEDE